MNENRWGNTKNGDPKVRPKPRPSLCIGGQWKAGGNNKLFFFYAHEYRPVTAAINNGNPIRIRVPTAAERAGDFSQTRDNNGALFNLIKDPTSTSPCTAANTAGCFQAGGTLGRIPADRLYQTGIALLSRYPQPNVTQAPGTNYNYEVAAPTTENLTQQPALRIDYQLSPNLRFSGKYSGQRARTRSRLGRSPVSTMSKPISVITNYGVTVNYTLNSSTFIEEPTASSGISSLEAPPSGLPVPAASWSLSPRTAVKSANFPLLYPNACVSRPVLRVQVLQISTPSGGRADDQHAAGFWGGSRIMGTAVSEAARTA